MPVFGLPPWFGLALMGAVCGGAIWKGDWEERTTGFGMLMAWVVTLVMRDPRWIGPQWGAFIADGLLLALLVGIALRTLKFWPIFAAGFHLLAVLTHAARMIDAGMGAWAYATAAVIWAYLVIITLAVGTWNTWRDQPQTAGPVDREAAQR